MNAKELYIPEAMIIAGVAMHLLAPGEEGTTIVGLALAMVVHVAFALAGCFITAGLLKISFGGLFSAVIKLAAVIIFPTGISAIAPITQLFFLEPVLYLGLMVWLFEIEWFEAVVCSAVIFVMKMLAATLIFTLLAG